MRRLLAGRPGASFNRREEFMSTIHRILALAAVLAVSSRLVAQVQGPATASLPATFAAPAAAPRVAELMLTPAASLEPVTVGAKDELEALVAWNRAGRLPTRNGVVRPLAEAIRFRPGTDPSGGLEGITFDSPAGARSWGTRVEVQGAYRLRLRLDDVRLPEGTNLWVHGAGEAPIRFGLDLKDAEGVLWTPSVSGESIYLEVTLPPGSSWERSGFDVTRVAELVALDRYGFPMSTPGPQAGECLADATCATTGTFDSVALLRTAVAHLQYIKNGLGYLCSGGLLNDTDGSTNVPLLLTAHHCFSTQASAASLEAFWDYKSASCNASFPNLGAVPRSNGSTLLATAAASDVTLVRLSGFPGSRALMGWDARTSVLTSGKALHRISHPAPDGFPFSQGYSRSLFDSSANGCGWSRTNNIFSNHVFGGTYPGSSGSPVLIDGGFVVGQLRGYCGPNPTNGCGYENYVVDGALYASWPLLQPFPDPQTDSNGPPPPVAPPVTSSEYPGYRFWVLIGNNRIGTKVDDCVPETVCIAGAIPTRAEVFVRIVGPKSNGYLWPNVVKFNTTKTEVWVQQVSTGRTRYYELPGLEADASELPGLVDKEGFLP